MMAKSSSYRMSSPGLAYELQHGLTRSGKINAMGRAEMSNVLIPGVVCLITCFPVKEKMFNSAPAFEYMSEFPDRMIFGADIADRP